MILQWHAFFLFFKFQRDSTKINNKDSDNIYIFLKQNIIDNQHDNDDVEDKVFFLFLNSSSSNLTMIVRCMDACFQTTGDFIERRIVPISQLSHS